MTSPSRPRRAPPREIAYDDVDDVIGIASEMQATDADHLSIEELREVASELDVPDRYVAPAVTELARRRAERLAAEAQRVRRRRVLVAAILGVLGVLVIWAVLGQASLSGDLAAVEAARAQVDNVVTLRKKRIAEWGPRADSRERTAELSGADNRVAVERRRYDAAAQAYNASVRSFPASLWAALFGLPSEVPPSDRVDGW